MRADLSKRLICSRERFFDLMPINVKMPLYPIVFRFEYGNGWFRIIDYVLRKMSEEYPIGSEDCPSITQIKEKCGMLNIYV